MKIGIITFHWATNYGAVLQAYALSTYLSFRGADVMVIDYYPAKYKKNIFNSLLTRHFKVIPKRLKEIPKEKQIESFREKHMKRTKYYSSNRQLKNAGFEFDCYITGSDQVWNVSFLKKGEGKKTYSYFLDFAPDDKILASYAASFGIAEYPDDLKENVKNQLRRFDFISVREETGLNIIRDLGFYENSFVVPDPTLLLQKNDYKGFLVSNERKYKYAYVYMLHGKDEDASGIIHQLKTDNMEIVKCNNRGIEEWLSDIYYSEFVITNSFHGVVFSIIFERPFVAVLIEGSGMNDRIITLLKRLKLSDRIFEGDMNIIYKNIDWTRVDQLLEEYRRVGYEYIDTILSYKKGRQ